ncbi:MAG: glycosyl hydrolase [Chloroflexota bacterium]
MTAALMALPLTVPPASAVPAPSAASAVGSDPRFGAVEAYRATDVATDAGVRWSRVVFWWSALQEGGPDDWNPFYFSDEVLDRELAAGRRVVGLLISTPPWASTNGSVNGVPAGLDLAPDDPGNLWADFARKIAERYRGRIDDWVIWNEPDVWDAASDTHTWDGSVEDFFKLQRSGYLAIKRANPSATVALPGLTYWWDHQYGRTQYFQRYLDAASRDPLAPANGWYFDVASLHLYNEPAGVFRVARLFHSLMQQRGFDKPIWVAETNVAPWNDPANPLPAGDFRATLDEQASYVIQAVAAGLAANVDRISVYSMTDGDTPVGTEQMGLVRADGSARPALDAYRVAQRYLAGASDGQMGSEGDVVQVRLARGADLVTVVWSLGTGVTPARITASGPRAVVVDKWGNEREIAAVDGAFALDLEPATASTVPHAPMTRMIGGNPLIVVETASAPSRPAPPPSNKIEEPPPVIQNAPPPVPSKPKPAPASSSKSSATATPTPKGKAAATAVPTATPIPTATPKPAPTSTPKPSTNVPPTATPKTGGTAPTSRR